MELIRLRMNGVSGRKRFKGNCKLENRHATIDRNEKGQTYKKSVPLKS